jgi:hypothetical protein
LLGDGGPVGTITLSCAADDEAIRIEGWADHELSSGLAPEYAELSEAILDAVVDAHELKTHEGRVGFVITKRIPRG